MSEGTIIIIVAAILGLIAFGLPLYSIIKSNRKARAAMSDDPIPEETTPVPTPETTIEMEVSPANTIPEPPFEPATIEVPAAGEVPTEKKGTSRKKAAKKPTTKTKTNTKKKAPGKKKNDGILSKDFAKKHGLVLSDTEGKAAKTIKQKTVTKRTTVGKNLTKSTSGR